MQRSFAYFKMQTALMRKSLEEWYLQKIIPLPAGPSCETPIKYSQFFQVEKIFHLPKLVRNTKQFPQEHKKTDTQRQSNKSQTTAQQQYKYNKINPPHNNKHTTKTLQDGQKDRRENIQQQHINSTSTIQHIRNQKIKSIKATHCNSLRLKLYHIKTPKKQQQHRNGVKRIVPC